MDDRDAWDPVMLEDYLASIDLRLGEEQLLEIRRKVLDRAVIVASHETRDKRPAR